MKKSYRTEHFCFDNCIMLYPVIELNQYTTVIEPGNYMHWFISLFNQRLMRSRKSSISDQWELLTLLLCYYQGNWNNKECNSADDFG